MAESQSVLVSGTHLGPMTNFSHSLFYYLFLTISGLLLWGALPAQPFSDLSPMGLMSIVYCLCFSDPNLEGQVPVFISPRNRVDQLYPQALGLSN
jgi:hypothetical protein